MKLQTSNLIIPLIIVNLFFGCTGSSEKGIKVIHTIGADAVYNMSKSNIQFGSVSLEDKISGIAVEEGDMLYFMSDNYTPEVMIRYSSLQGNRLSFQFDSLQPFILKINNQIFATQLDDSISWTWAKNSSNEVLKGIHSISLTLPIKKDQFDILSRLSDVLKFTGLMINAESGFHQLNKILSLFKPEWLFILADTSWTINDSTICNLDKVELLYLNSIPEFADINNNIQKLNNLRQIIAVSDSGKYNFENSIKHKNLTSFNFIGSQIRSTAELQLPGKLTSLFFIDCDSLVDVHSLTEYKKLHSLGFTGCQKLQDISAIQGMKNLIWLSCPPGITQAQFDTLIPSLLSLQSLELIDCDSLTNINAVKKLDKLKSLTLACSSIKPCSISDLKNLELLVIEPDTGKTGKVQLMKLRNQLTNTLVVPGEGFCLGSGWILVILPFIGIIMFLFKRFKP